MSTSAQSPAPVNTTKVAFALTLPRSVCASVRPGDVLGVVISDATGGTAPLDPAKVIQLTSKTQSSTAVSSPIATSPHVAAKWVSAKPLMLPRGATFKYKYAIVSSTGAFVAWEKLPGTVDNRTFTTGGKSMIVEDTFGEMDDERVQRQLDQTAEEFRMDDRARAIAISERLRALFGPGRRLMLVTYSLPVILRRSRSTGQWTASWIEDDFLARTEHSIAYDVPTLWVGCVTRECIDMSTGEESMRPKRTSSVCSENDALSATEASKETPEASAAAPPSPPLRASLSPDVPCIIDTLTAGGLELTTPDRAEADAGATESQPSVLPGSPPFVYLPTSTAVPRKADQPADPAARAAATPEIAETTRHDASPSKSDTITVSFSRRDMVEITRVLNTMNVIPIFLPTDLHEGFARYCLSVLKPCMHNVLETGAQDLFPYASSLSYLREGWRQFVAANEMIADILFQSYNAGDVVWLNDYQLSMVPPAMRRRCERAGMPRPPQVYFMHSPFPTSEIFRTLPVRDDILDAVLECDVVGFHTFNYARHFLQSAKRLLGVNFQSRRGGSLALEVDGRDVMVSISHVGVEAHALDRWMASEQAAEVARMFATRYPNKVIIAGVDTCQRLSGVALKLLAFERLLEENPVYRHKVVLVQRCEMREALTADIARTSQELRDRVEKIRNMYGDVIDYEEAASFSPTYRVGLFHQADIFLQTPIREGLNLLPLEYVYVRTQWQMQRSKMYATGVDVDVGTLSAQAFTPTPDDGTPMAASAAAPPSTRAAVSTFAQATHAAPFGRLDHGALGGRSSSTGEAPHSRLDVPGHARLLHAQKVSQSEEPALPDAAIKAMTQGMPKYYAYATLGAQPSASRKPALSSIFRQPGAAGEASTPASQSHFTFPSGTSVTGGDSAASTAGGTTRSRSVSPSRSTTSEPPPTGSAVGGIRPLSTRSAQVGASSLLSPPPDPALAGHLADAGPEMIRPPQDAQLTAPLPPPPRGGCVILSEFSTASQILNSNLVVNPWNIALVAKEVDKALLMTDAERAFRQWRDYQYAVRNPAASWSRQVIADAIDTYLTRQRQAAAAEEASSADVSPVAAVGPLSVVGSRSITAAPVRSSAVSPQARPPAGASTIFSMASAAPAPAASRPPAHGAPPALAPLRLEGASDSMPALVMGASHAMLEPPMLNKKSGVPLPPRLPVADVVSAFRRARRCAIFLDYGGTIMQREKPVRAARTDFTIEGYSRHMPTEVLDALAKVSADARATVYVVSGLRAAAIDSLHLSRLQNIGLAAENGNLISPPHRMHVVAPGSAGSSGSTSAAASLGEQSGDALGYELTEWLGTPTPSTTEHASPLPVWTSMGSVQPPVVRPVGVVGSSRHHSHHSHGSSGGSHPAETATPPQDAHEFNLPPLSRSAAKHARQVAPARTWTALMHECEEDAKVWAAVRERAIAVMTDYQWRVNGSQVRVYDSLIAWDFRNADGEWAQSQAKFVAADLESLSSHQVKVSVRKSRVEVSLRTMHKGKFIAEILRRMPSPPDFLLVAGDDTTDEEMFSAAHSWQDDAAASAAVGDNASPPSVFTILVGRPEKASSAQYSLQDVPHMQRLLNDLAAAANPREPDIAGPPAAGHVPQAAIPAAAVLT